MVEDLFAYFLLFSVGISFFYNFVFHVFFGDMAAELIGWKQSPFQAEVGFARLGVRAAAVAGVSCFLLGAAWGHVYQMIVAENFAPGNAGVIFYTDIGIPIIGFCLLWLQHRFGRESASSEKVRGEVART
jgi:hypothetical protein